MTRLFANCLLDPVQRPKCYGLAHIISVSVLIRLAELSVNSPQSLMLRGLALLCPEKYREVSGGIAGKLS
jgi:hypothetical protein